MDKKIRTALEIAERGVIERSSRQSFRSSRNGGDMMLATTPIDGLWERTLKNEPQYGIDCRAYDAWLLKIATLEPHLGGALRTVTTIDANRGWQLIGPRRRVRQWHTMLSRAEFMPTLRGWHDFFAAISQSYWATCMGAVIELGRIDGEIAELYYTDPTKCRLSTDYDKPLVYGGAPWSADTFWRLTLKPSLDENLRGMGWSAVAAAVRLARLMLLVLYHDEGQLSPETMRGILTLTGMSENQFLGALRMRHANTDRVDMPGAQYLQQLLVLANTNESVDIKINTFSQLPNGFDRQSFLDHYMAAIALLFERDLREFWPGPASPIGQATESAIQHQKATNKGNLSLSRAFARRLMADPKFPADLQFEFDEYDTAGQLVAAQVLQMYGLAAETLIRAGVPRANVLSILVGAGILPNNATDTVEADKAGDLTPAALDRERILDLPNVRRAIERSGGRETIISVKWPTSTEQIIWNPEHDAIRRYWHIRRADDAENTQDRLEIGLRALLTLALLGGIDSETLAERITIYGLSAAILAWAAGQYAPNGGTPEWPATVKQLRKVADELLAVRGELTAEQSVMAAELGDRKRWVDAFGAAAADELDEIDHQNRIAAENFAHKMLEINTLTSEETANARQRIAERIILWGAIILAASERAKTHTTIPILLQWQLGNTEKHCNTCARFAGVIKTPAEWRATGYAPRGRNLECGGFKCDCRYVVL